MDQSAEELYSLLVPLHRARVIVPRTCVAEIVRYSSPQDRAAGSLEWFRGFISWNSLQVPIISLEDMCDLPSAEPGGRTRVAIFNGLSDALSGRVFGLLTEGFPQLVRVSREVMEPYDEREWDENGPIICQVRMINEYPMIPDLEVLESLVQEQVAAC